MPAVRLRLPAFLSLVRRAGGFTLIELCIVTAMAAILLAIGIPSFRDMLDRRRLEGQAHELATHLQMLRSEAVARNETMRITFQSQWPKGTCYVIHTGSEGACDCLITGAPICSGNEKVATSVYLPSGRPLRVAANVRSIEFDSAFGRATPTGTVWVADGQGRRIEHKVNILGRVRSCARGGLPDYAPC